MVMIRNGARGVVAGEAGLAHARAVVDDERLHVFVLGHGCNLESCGGRGGHEHGRGRRTGMRKGPRRADSARRQILSLPR